MRLSPDVSGNRRPEVSANVERDKRRDGPDGAVGPSLVGVGGP